METKGLSEIITSLIIILLSLVAVGILWVVVSNIIAKSSEDVSLDAMNVDLRIKEVKIFDSQNISIKIKREPGQGNLNLFMVTLKTDTTSENIKLNDTLVELQEKTFSIKLLNLNASTIKEVIVTPISKSESGTEKLSQRYDLYKVRSHSYISSGSSSSSSGGPSCIPTTCLAIGKNCGTWQNGTGTECGILDCGTCSGTTPICSLGVCVRNDTLFLKNGGIPGIVSWWRLNGNMNDEIGTTPGSCSGLSCPTPTTGKYSRAYDFDGINNHINVSSPSGTGPYITTNKITVSTWFKANGFGNDGGNNSIVGKIDLNGNWDKGYLIFYDTSTNKLSFYIKEISKSATKSFVNDGAWHHVVGTFDGSTINIFLDNETGTSYAYLGNMNMVNTIDLRIGSSSGISSIPYYFFNGSIDEVMIFNRSLTSTEVSTLYGLNLSM